MVEKCTLEEKKGLAFTVVMICMKMLLTEKEKERENLLPFTIEFVRV